MKKVWALAIALVVALLGAAWAQPAMAGVLTLATVTGLCVGSFLNVVVWRLPQMLQREGDAAARDLLGIPPAERETFNLSFPHSHCPCCKTRLGVSDLVPVLSWLQLRGQCRYCSSAVAARYPLVELLTGGLSLATVAALGAVPVTLMVLLVVWLSVPAALIDADTYTLPDELTQPLLWVVLLASAAGGGTIPPGDAVWGAAAGYGSAAVLASGGRLLFGRESLGQGDWKYLAAAGALLGFSGLPMVWLCASASALLWALSGSFRLNKQMSLHQQMPFGPHLVTATLALVLLRPAITQLQWQWGIKLL